MRSILVLLLLIPLSVFAQQPYKTESKRAIEFYKNGLSGYNAQNYQKAEENLKKAINQDVQFQNAYLVLAEVYWEQRKYEEAIKYYADGLSIDPKFYPRGYINKGKLEIKAGRYENAIESFTQFQKLRPKDSVNAAQAKMGIKQARFAIYSIANPVDFNPVNLGPNVNTQSEEYWPSLSADGQTLLITRLVDAYDVTLGKSMQEDFFFSRFEEGSWSPMKNAGRPLNTAYNEGAQSISADGKLMVYTVCPNVYAKRGVIGECDLFYSERTGDDWSEPKNMGPPINTASKETQPSLSADGRSLYFASSRPGGKGGLDLYRSSRKDDGIWSKPVNLGDSVNTPGDDMSPFIHHDNTTLYFSSNEHIGMGNFDLYYTKEDDDGKFVLVKNLGYPINTAGHEIGLIVNAKGNTAYYASEMQKENGKDIYQFSLYEEARPQEVSYIKGVVFDKESRKRLKANFELYSLESGALISKAHSDERTGEFLLCIPTDQNYMLNVDRKGYLFFSDNFALNGIYHVDKPFLKDVPLNPIGSGESIVLRNVFYNTDSYALLPESQYELNKIVKFLEINSDFIIEISGHTDNVGNQEYNNLLSENRAKSVVEYLTEKGIDRNRLSYKGYGFSISVDTNDTDEGRARNRRTELKVIN